MKCKFCRCPEQANRLNQTVIHRFLPVCSDQINSTNMEWLPLQQECVLTDSECSCFRVNYSTHIHQNEESLSGMAMCFCTTLWTLTLRRPQKPVRQHQQAHTCTFLYVCGCLHVFLFLPCFLISIRSSYSSMLLTPHTPRLTHNR